MGRSIDEGTALQSRNELLRASVATLADDQRIERLAAGMGMVMPAAAEVGFLSHHRSDGGRAARSIHAPDSTTFLTSLQALAASAQPATTTIATSTGTPTTSITVTPTTSSTVTPTAASTVTPTAASTVTPTAASTVTPTAASTVTPTAASTVTPAAAVPSSSSGSTTGG
jgi:hypothetical protein